MAVWKKCKKKHYEYGNVFQKRRENPLKNVSYIRVSVFLIFFLYSAVCNFEGQKERFGVRLGGNGCRII